jgi:2-haloalkanoic acid dehalogenase type II
VTAPAGSLDLSRFEALTFDCYGTLIDWETGLLAALRTALAGAAGTLSDETLLESFARHEAALEGGPYRPYRDILAGCLDAIASEHGIGIDDAARLAFGGSVAAWPAFPDSPEALARLHARYRLGVVTNCDDDLFAASERRLGIAFDWVVTAQQLGSYKPDPRNIEAILERIGRPRERVLHVAQSLYHDHVPAKALGLATVWVDRRRGRSGFGATPAAEATPDLVVADMATLADLATT